MTLSVLRSLSSSNSNVRYGVWASVLHRLGTGMYANTVLPSYILFLGGSNTAVGFAEGLWGLANMVAAVPSGFLADKGSKSIVVRFGSIVQLLGAACLIGSATLADAQNGSYSYILICFALLFDGLGQGIVSGPLIALMDNSCPLGGRGEVKSTKQITTVLAEMVGIFIGLLIILDGGDNWSLDSVRIVLIWGAFLGRLAMIPQWLLDDNQLLLEAEAPWLQEVNSDVRARNTATTCCGCIGVENVRMVLFITHCCLAFGALGSARFFPLFFQEECALQPSNVQATMLCLSFLQVFSTDLAHRASKHIGRLEVVIISYTIGVSCTGSLSFLKRFYSIPWIVLPLFTTRCVFQWGSMPLQSAVEADYTPSGQRSLWEGLFSVNQMGWSLSVMVGGYIIDHFGFERMFMIVALLQACVIPMWCSLLPLVATEKELTRS